MKRTELLKKSKKIFAAVLTAAMVANSVVPGSLVLASEDGTESVAETMAETSEDVEPGTEIQEITAPPGGNSGRN